MISFDLTNVTAGLIGIIFPIYILLTYEKVKNNIIQDHKHRLLDYKKTLLIFWTLTFLILINHLTDNSLSLSFSPKHSWTNIGLTFLVLGFAYFQYTTLKVSGNNAFYVKRKLNDIYYYLPKIKKELKWFLLLSVSAGVCEEIMYRLFLFEYLNLHIHLIFAFLLSNLFFAMTHIGSGKANLISSLFLGLMFSVIYYLTDNIWISVILHTAIDINIGILGYRLSKVIKP